MQMAGRTYFLANACHVCKSKTASCACEICGMAFYCSPGHRRSDWFDHSRICWALGKVRGRCECLWELSVGKSSIGFKHEVAGKVSELLKRRLLPWELEMIYHPRVCAVCGEHDRKRLSFCDGCGFVCTCEKRHFRSDHAKWCETLRLYSDVIVYQSRGGKPVGDFSEVELTNYDALGSMADVLSGKCELENEYESSRIRKALTSEVLTYPLTVLEAVKAIGASRSSRLEIVFVGAENQAEVEPASKWERYLLHYLEEVNVLNLIFLGPELRPPARKSAAGLCESCRKRKRNLKMEFIGGKFYHQHRAGGAAQPALICAFNSGMYRDHGFRNENSWKDTIEKLFARGNPPVLITEYTRRELEMVLEKVENLCGDVNAIVPLRENPFASLKPGLNIISEEEAPVIFKNYYYAILQK